MMTRAGLEDRKCAVQREAQYLSSIETNCITCEKCLPLAPEDVRTAPVEQTHSCLYHGAIPVSFMRIGCDKWELQDSGAPF